MWRRITEDDLTKKISSVELDALRMAALGDGDDPIDAHITQTTDLIRGYIITASIDLGPAGTLPDRLIGPACDVIILDIMSRAAGTVIDDGNVRRDNARAARDLFKMVAAGKYAIDDPITGETASANPTPIYKPTRTRQFTRQTQDGI